MKHMFLLACMLWLQTGSSSHGVDAAKGVTDVAFPLKNSPPHEFMFAVKASLLVMPTLVFRSLYERIAGNGQM